MQSYAMAIDYYRSLETLEVKHLPVLFPACATHTPSNGSNEHKATNYCLYMKYDYILHIDRDEVIGTPIRNISMES